MVAFDVSDVNGICEAGDTLTEVMTHRSLFSFVFMIIINKHFLHLLLTSCFLPAGLFSRSFPCRLASDWSLAV